MKGSPLFIGYIQAPYGDENAYAGMRVRSYPMYVRPYRGQMRTH